MAVPGDLGRSLAIGRNADGRLEAFRISNDNTIWHNWEITAGGPWSGWSMLGVPENKGQFLAVGTNADGRLEAYVTGMDNTIWHNWQTTPGGGTSRKEWSGWSMLGVSENKGIGLLVESNANGRLEVFVIGMDNTIWHNWQTTYNGGPSRKEWSGWSMLGVPENRGISLDVRRNDNRRLEAFLISMDNTIWHNWQTTPGGGTSRKEWSGWSMLGVPENKGISLAVGTNADGRLEVFLIGTAYNIYHNWQTTPGGPWSGWSMLGGPRK